MLADVENAAEIEIGPGNVSWLVSVLPVVRVADAKDLDLAIDEGFVLFSDFLCDEAIACSHEVGEESVMKRIRSVYLVDYVSDVA